MSIRISGHFAFLFLGMAIASLALAEWTSTLHSAPTGELAGAAAEVINESGFVVTVIKSSADGSGWIRFSLPENSMEKIDRNRLIDWHVDGTDVNSLADSKRNHFEWRDSGMNISMFEYEGQAASERIWHGKIEEGMGGNIKQMLEGEKLFATYFLGSGEEKQTVFSLSGAGALLRTIFDLPVEGEETADQIESEEFREAVGKASDDCAKPNAPSMCIFRMAECMRSGGDSADEFNDCFYDD